MRKFTLLLLVFACFFSVRGQTNLNLTAIASASASSSGSYGPSNWNDGIINGATFGWVGTAPNQPTPSYMEFSWNSAQTFDSIIVVNLSTNFAPPNGNGVVFVGTADLEYYDGSQWVYITSFSGQGSYGDSFALNFTPVTGSKLRITNLNTGTNPVNHNPGFDEIEVYLSPQPPVVYDAALTQLDTLLNIGAHTLIISAVISNVGNQILDTLAVNYQLSNNPAAVSESFYLALAPNADTTLLLAQSIDLDTLPSPLFSEMLCVWTSTALDVSNTNDTLCLSLLSLSHHEPVVHHEIIVYPNPTHGRFTLKSEVPLVEISVFRTDGSIVYSRSFDDQLQAEMRTDLPDGMYLVRVQNNAGNYTITRIVIQEGFF